MDGWHSTTHLVGDEGVVSGLDEGVHQQEHANSSHVSYCKQERILCVRTDKLLRSFPLCGVTQTDRKSSSEKSIKN